MHYATTMQLCLSIVISFSEVNYTGWWWMVAIFDVSQKYWVAVIIPIDYNSIIFQDGVALAHQPVYITETNHGDFMGFNQTNLFETSF